MNKIVDYVSWGFILIFAVPTVLIMASWNSLPGQPMFGVKRSFEQVLLFFVKPSYAAEASLNVQFTQRRFNEAKMLLANDESTEGLSYLSQQIKATKTVINRAPNKAKQREIAQNYIATLRAVSQELEVAQQAMIHEPGSQPSQYQPTRIPTAVRQPTSASQPTHIPTPTPTPGLQPSQEEEVEDIQEEIEDTIEDLEHLSQAEIADDDDDDDNDDDNDDDDDNGGQGQGQGQGNGPGNGPGNNN